MGDYTKQLQKIAELVMTGRKKIGLDQKSMGMYVGMYVGAEEKKYSKKENGKLQFELAEIMGLLELLKEKRT